MTKVKAALKLRSWVAPTPAAAAPKKKQVVKRKALLPVAPETTSIDPPAGDSAFGNMPQRYKT
jgi:hypothetical protein